MGDRRLADLLAVATCSPALSLWGVDHEVDVTTGDQVDGVDPVALRHLADDRVDTDTEAGQIVGRAGGCSDPETEGPQLPGDDDARRLVAVGQGQEHRPLGGQDSARGELRL